MRNVILLISGSLTLMIGCGSPPSSSLTAQPTIASITPASGSGSTQVFTATFSHAGGAAKIATARMLFNRQQDGRMACYLYYDRPSASFLLVNDSGEGTTRQPAGAAAHLENSQCDLDVNASSAVVAGNELSVRAALTFKPGFSGIMNVYLYSDDTSGQSTGLHKQGTWYVP